jgi:SAM-dependent methyltransferase
VAGRHPQPSHPPLLGSLTRDTFPPDGSTYYEGNAARWYSAVYAWKTDDIPFYLAQAERWAGPGGAVLELACGNGRVALPMARAGHRVAAVDSSKAMLEQLADRLREEPEPVRERVEPLRQDIRHLQLDRLFRFVYLPFNTMLVLLQPHERQAMLEGVREHLAPSGAFAFDIFTPDPARLVDDADWSIDVEVEADDPGGEGRVHVRRDCLRRMDYGHQTMRLRFRHLITRDDTELARWEDELELAYIFPRELELILERQGFRIEHRYGGAEGQPYEPATGNLQQQFVVAKLVP